MHECEWRKKNIKKETEQKEKKTIMLSTSRIKMSISKYQLKNTIKFKYYYIKIGFDNMRSYCGVITFFIFFFLLFVCLPSFSILFLFFFLNKISIEKNMLKFVLHANKIHLYSVSFAEFNSSISWAHFHYLDKKNKEFLPSNHQLIQWKWFCYALLLYSRIVFLFIYRLLVFVRFQSLISQFSVYFNANDIFFLLFNF